MRTFYRNALAEADADEAQLILSLLVWPKDCPDPSVVDEWVRRKEAGPVTAVSLAGREQTTRPGKTHGSTPS